MVVRKPQYMEVRNFHQWKSSQICIYASHKEEKTKKSHKKKCRNLCRLENEPLSNNYLETFMRSLREKHRNDNFLSMRNERYRSEMSQNANTALWEKDQWYFQRSHCGAVTQANDIPVT